MLSAYTLPLIILLNVDGAEAIFDIAVARGEEIFIGIVAASIIGTIIFPMSIRPVLSARINTLISDAASWAQEVLLAKGSDPQSGSGWRLISVLWML